MLSHVLPPLTSHSSIELQLKYHLLHEATPAQVAVQAMPLLKVILANIFNTVTNKLLAKPRRGFGAAVLMPSCSPPAHQTVLAGPLIPQGLREESPEPPARPPQPIYSPQAPQGDAGPGRACSLEPSHAPRSLLGLDPT